MEEKFLLDTMLEVASGQEKRIDNYLKSIQTFLKGSKDWTQQHEDIFNEMLKEVRTSRLVKIGSIIAAAVIVVTFIVILIVSGSQDIRIKSNERMINLIRNSQLAVKLKNDRNPNGMAVEIDLGSLKRKGKVKDAEILKEVSILGRHYGLNPDRNLKLRNQSNNRSLKFQVFPESCDKEQPLGTIEIRERNSFLDQESAPVRIGEVIFFPDLSNFCIQVSNCRVITTTRGPDNEYGVLWKVKFGERKDEDNIVYSQEYPINKTPDGRIETRPIWIYNSRWENFYVVTVGIGRLGNENNERLAWNLKSFARQFTVNEVCR